MAGSQHGPDDTLDPLLWKETLGYTRGRVHYNSLVQFNDDLTVRPELAKSWESNSNATEFTFELERGVTFHDGKDFTADDVVYTMQQHLGEDSVSIGKALVTMIREWKKIDKHTVKAVLDSPNADLPIILGTFNFKIIQANAHDDPNYFNKGIGTGPFVTTEFKPGIIDRAVRNPNYWRDGPYLDEVHTFGIGGSTRPGQRVDLGGGRDDCASRSQSLKTGRRGRQRYCDLGSIQPVHRAGSGYRKTPGNNPDFVLAMKHLVPRKQMMRSILKGEGALGNDHPVGPTFAMNCDTLEQRLQDLDKAKFHLKKSGITEALVDTSDAAVGGVDLCIFAQAEGKKDRFGPECATQCH